ncbi:diiron oxygenase [Streptomyces sp. ISL-10]|uniref:diiron oxygenase n=1 Tax=Streptomyces sp. ISL-10 TaxID=2819172 RepID=UPI001BE66D81|nr:diiron oxygenase [Streptomyces sp. ISL-10]MBT2363965.1 diiron oxygenase [Streptomyces sp. ISL-10]
MRSRPQRSFEASGSLYFPPELHPVVTHPLVAACGSEQVEWLLLRRLHDYLDFTSELESLGVIPVATAISRGRSGLHLPDGMRADAFKIVTDEAWHAQGSYDFAQQLQRASGVAPGRPDGSPPAFAERLDAIREGLPHEVRGVEAILFAIVSETLISGVLSAIPRDDRLPRSVRDHVRDHAEDEGRHHVYFRSVLRHLWAALTPKERKTVGPHVPAAIYAFLEPDYTRAIEDLRLLGLPDRIIEQVVEESWPRQQVVHDVSEASRSLVRYFAEVRAFDEPGTRNAFEEAGLLSDAER